MVDINPVSNRATNSPYAIYDDTTQVYSADVDQEQAPAADVVDSGSNFQHLGSSVTISSGTLVVQLTDDANEYVIADAVRIECTSTGSTTSAGSSLLGPVLLGSGDCSSQSPVIIDDGDAGFATSGTGWGSGSGHGGDASWHAAGSGSSAATWTFTSLPAGDYQVSITWLEGGNRATKFALHDL